MDNDPEGDGMMTYRPGADPNSSLERSHRTRVLKRISEALDGRPTALRERRFSAAREAELLAYAATLPDEDILDWHNTGPAILHWIRTHQDSGQAGGNALDGHRAGSEKGSSSEPVSLVFGDVLKSTGWRVEVLWNGSAGWFTARLVSLVDRDNRATYPGGFLVPFEDPIGASGSSPREALDNLSEAVLEWA